MIPPDTGTTEEFVEFLKETKILLRWVLSPELQRQLFPLKFIFVLFGIGFLVMVVYFLLKTSYMEWWFLGFLKDFLFPKVFEKKFLIKRWRKIKNNMKTDIEEKWKLNIIEGANLIDKILKDAGYAGDNLGDRLQRVDKEEIVNLDRLKKANQVVVNITSDPDYRLSKQKADEVIDILEQSLTDLGIL